MALLKPRPRCSATDSSNGCFIYGKTTSNVVVASSIGSDLPNLIFSQFRKAVPLASIGSAVQCSIRHIFRACTPSQISKIIICWVAVGMKAFHAIRTLPNKSAKNQCMDAGLLFFRGKCHIKVPTLFSPWRQNALFCYSYSAVAIDAKARQGLDSSSAANKVSCFVPDNLAPLFLHIQSPITKAPLKGVWRRHGLSVFGSYPSHTGALYG